MLDSSFLHFPGVGPALAARLGEAGIRTWDDALRMELPCGKKRAETIRASAEESKKRLLAGDIRWFGDALPPAEQWRLFPHFKNRAAYVDIETTGLSRSESCITTIALYGGGAVRTYVRGVNLEDFADDILEYALLVTWNGRGFDAPILRGALNIPLDKGGMGHLDLLPVLRALGLRGGLKSVEKRLGIDRGMLDGADGLFAVRLWNAYERTGDERCLTTLLAYNTADVLSLEYLAAYAVMRHTGISLEEQGIAAVSDRNPYVPDRGVLSRFRY